MAVTEKGKTAIMFKTNIYIKAYQLKKKVVLLLCMCLIKKKINVYFSVHACALITHTTTAQKWLEKEDCNPVQLHRKNLTD